MCALRLLEAVEITASIKDKEMFGRDVKVTYRDSSRTIYEVEDSNGFATIACYDVFSGVQIFLNDIHVQNMPTDAAPSKNRLVINYCRSGSVECDFVSMPVCLESGDIHVSNQNTKCRKVLFPKRRFEGISIMMDIDLASKSLSKPLDNVSVNVDALRKKYGERYEGVTMRSNFRLDNLFSELYCIPEEMRTSYFQIKTLEVLLLLSSMPIDETNTQYCYRPKSQIIAIKGVKDYITENADRHITIKELSKVSGLSPTLLNSCFKSIYGDSVSSYISNRRIANAAHLLIETDKRILEIAGMVGYDNASKFSSAFKKSTGLTPSEYRKRSSWKGQLIAVKPSV